MRFIFVRIIISDREKRCALSFVGRDLNCIVWWEKMTITSEKPSTVTEMNNFLNKFTEYGIMPTNMCNCTREEL